MHRAPKDGCTERGKIMQNIGNVIASKFAIVIQCATFTFLASHFLHERTSLSMSTSLSNVISRECEDLREKGVREA
jgi:hypothetical protein